MALPHVTSSTRVPYMTVFVTRPRCAADLMNKGPAGNLSKVPLSKKNSIARGLPWTLFHIIHFEFFFFRFFRAISVKPWQPMSHVQWNLYLEKYFLCDGYCRKSWHFVLKTTPFNEKKMSIWCRVPIELKFCFVLYLFLKIM